MKFLVFLLFILSLSSAHGFEIQCKTRWEDVLVVLKTSPETQKTYLLFLNENEVEKYWIFPSTLITNNEDLFLFKDAETSVVIDKQTLVGKITSNEAIFRNKAFIPLNECSQF